MIKIILNDNIELNNDQKLGWNLDIDGIKECLNEVGYYELFTKEVGWKRIYKNDVKDIISA
ncbi:hypothetical protein ACDN41_12305 [Priestia aryabhattai]|uniref:hypothetical protein n=1 Tax=Priestia aryabhattai TaxID=412384 RepID=UPI0035323FDE